MTSGAVLLPAGLRAEVEQAVSDSAAAWDAFVAANDEHPAAPTASCLAVKYVAAKHASDYRAPNKGLFIGSSSYTWGTGVYVTGVVEPLSTAIYGRVGVISRFRTAGWRAFDARTPQHQALYLRWLHAQVDYPEAVLTVHTDHWLHGFRDLFREQFHIDVVLFHPDELDAHGWYTNPADTWLAVSDWDPTSTALMTGFSQRFTDARLALLVEEDFTPDPPGLTRAPQISLSRAAPVAAGLEATVRRAYATGIVARVPS
jgi:hypothetical protein